MYTIMPYLLTAALAASPQIAEEPQKTIIKGDFTTKLSNGLDGETVPQDAYRFRLNLLAATDLGPGRLVGFTRHDGLLRDPVDGAYGIDAIRYGSGECQLGVASLKGPAGRSYHGHIFAKPIDGLVFLGNIPLQDGSIDDSVLGVEYTKRFGSVEARGLVLDNLGIPGLQRLEVELSSGTLDGGWQPTAQYNRVSTPEGHKHSFEVGLRKGFNSSCRKEVETEDM